MKVSSKPSLTWEILTTRADCPRQDVFPFNTGRCEYFYSARYALAAALDVLNLSANQAILMPSYNCWVEVEPVVRSGAKIDWYRVKTDFSIDDDDLVARIRPETAAIFVIHYLGFPQRLENIRRICTERGIILIEDCAHALLSNDGDNPLGSMGDMAIFSIRKTVPTPDGGCLLINNPVFSVKRTRSARPNRFVTYFVASEMLAGGTRTDAQRLGQMVFSFNLAVARFVRVGLKGIHKVLQDRGDYLVYPSGNNFREQAKNWGMSDVSAAIIRGSDFKQIKERRRTNFLYLVEKLKNDDRCSLPIQSLSEGVCPLFFPVIVPDRYGVYRKLKDKGLSGHDWWGDFHPAVPWESFPDAVYLKKNVFGFPVHQDVVPNNLGKMLAEFRQSL